MSLDEIKYKLIDLCGAIFRDFESDTNLLEYMDFVEDLGMDSITFICLIVELEDAFSITIPDDMLLIEYYKNIDEITQIVASLLNKET